MTSPRTCPSSAQQYINHQIWWTLACKTIQKKNIQKKIRRKSHKNFKQIFQWLIFGEFSQDFHLKICWNPVKKCDFSKKSWNSHPKIPRSQNWKPYFWCTGRGKTISLLIIIWDFKEPRFSDSEILRYWDTQMLRFSDTDIPRC